MSITVIYHAVSLTVFMLCLTVLRNTLVSITDLSCCVSDCIHAVSHVLRNTVRDTA
jgi:glutamyl/glutaminyl-tRNA synthetase